MTGAELWGLLGRATPDVIDLPVIIMGVNRAENEGVVVTTDPPGLRGRYLAVCALDNSIRAVHEAALPNRAERAANHQEPTLSEAGTALSSAELGTEIAGNPALSLDG